MNLILESWSFAAKEFRERKKWTRGFENLICLPKKTVHDLLCKICLLVDDSYVKCVSLLVRHSGRLGVAATRAHL